MLRIVDKESDIRARRINSLPSSIRLSRIDSNAVLSLAMATIGGEDCKWRIEPPAIGSAAVLLMPRGRAPLEEMYCTIFLQVVYVSRALNGGGALTPGAGAQ
jgi:hypothetical protein